MAISDVEALSVANPGLQPFQTLLDQNIASAILAPIAHEGKLLGIMELVSPNKKELNGINATKLEDIMPFIVSYVVRSVEEEKNQIDAIIQNECTTVHPAVHWRFQQEAENFLHTQLNGGQPEFKEIVFNEVYPLYGQTDIKDSARHRNLGIQNDLLIQLSEIERILQQAF